MAKKNYSLENTKPIFNREKILSIHNLYVHHVFIELFKILKNRQPISLANLFQLSLRSSSFIIRIPQFKLDLSKHNFVHIASTTWNSLISKVIDKCKPNECNVIIPGSSGFSDLSAPISIIKSRVKSILFEAQQLTTPGREIEWFPYNSWNYT